MLTRLRRCPEISGESESNNVTSAQSPICKCPRNRFEHQKRPRNRFKLDQETVWPKKPFKTSENEPQGLKMDWTNE